MILESDFDDVHDCQEAFRRLLYAASHPGEPVRISPYPGGSREGSDAALLMLALTLLDKETSFGAADNPAFARTVTELAYARQTASQPQFLFATGQLDNGRIMELLSAAAAGTLEEPHKSTTLLVAVEKLPEESGYRLRGPGIKGQRAVRLPAYARQWVACRDAMGCEYPAGVDLFFVSPDGECLAIPRKITVEG